MFTIVEPGFQTTIQDLGRPGLGDQGISAAGPMDPLALRLGNLIVANAPNAAALELTLLGPTLQFERDAVIVLAGAPFAVTLYPSRLNFRPVNLSLWEAIHVRPGDRLTIGAATAGARAYLCLAGGIDTPPMMGSRATHLIAGLGGLDGRPLLMGDRLPIGATAQPLDRLIGRRLKRSVWPDYPAEITVRVILGPQADRFTEDAITTFLSQPYAITTEANRMGVRLAGPLLAHVRGADLLSEGIGWGAVQVPQNGQPIILMADRQTTGGYTKIATVISADIGRIGQARPGSQVRFQAINIETALAARQAQEAWVDEANIERDAVWGAADVLAVMREFAQSGLGELRLVAGGVRLVLRRDVHPTANPFNGKVGEPEAQPAAPSAVPEENGGPALIEITAPLLGIYYAAPAPDAPPYVQVGDTIEVGQVVALIDVMKTHHQVRATHAGRIEAVLVENGGLVEYGEPLIRLKTQD